jgi:hypothetical protein
MVAGNTDGIGRDSVANWKIVSNNSFPFSQQKLQVLAYVKWEVSQSIHIDGVDGVFPYGKLLAQPYGGEKKVETVL